MAAPPNDLASLSDIMYIDEDSDDTSDIQRACASQASTDLTLKHSSEAGIAELVKCTCSSIVRNELQNLESQESVTGSHESSCEVFMNAVDRVSSFTSSDTRSMCREDLERCKNFSSTPKTDLNPQTPDLVLNTESQNAPPVTDYKGDKLESDVEEKPPKSETPKLIDSCDEDKTIPDNPDKQQTLKQAKSTGKNVKIEAVEERKTQQGIQFSEPPKNHATLAEVGKCDTAPSALASVVSDTTADTSNPDNLPQNCSVAYTCTESELEDLSKSKYQGLSGHLMDYYLTMVFPGQPGNQGNTENGTCGPIEPIFQIGEELIQKTPITKTALEDEFDSGDRKIILGICAMEKKSRSKPMLAILERLAWFEYIETLIFDENTILHEPVERWPICDVFVSFHSRGFPLSKAIQYVNCRKPIVVNDLDLQYTLQDRRAVHRILEQENIPHPRYMVVDRDTSQVRVLDSKTELPLSNGSSFIEMEDSVEMDGMVFQKPFVEKPVSAEDHNVYIYFPTAAGGGSQRLFRKVGSRSSIYSNYTRVRKTGSYIYEDFMPTDGTDVKVYTVGPDYAHAEARKSPALDGKVERDQNGKEVRYPVILSANEKMIARKVTLAFKQTVCGFDLLRANGESLVCDVNGFSFVKTSSKYYDDCAKVLGTMIMRALAPQLHIPWVLGSAPEDIPVVPTTSGTMMELRCVTAVIRHGDRTPKQKMKMEVKQKRPCGSATFLFERFFELFEKYDGYKTGQLKLKQPKHLQEVLDIVRYLLQEHQVRPDPEIEEKKAKLEQLKLVLEMYGYFSGINRKVQLKYQPNGRPKRSSSEDGIAEVATTSDVTSDVTSGVTSEVPEEFVVTLETLMYEFSGIHRKVQIKDQPYSVQKTKATPPSKSRDDEDDSPREPSLLLIVKWGGELTPAGKIQAEQLGKAFRSLYPGGQGEYGAPGLGILRLHSTYRHDLKIYASDEGRVQMTAAAFAKGLLALEGELPPILVQMVKCANTNGLLDSEGETTKYQHVVKEKLRDILNQNRDFTELDYAKLAPALSQSLIKAIRFIRNPFQMCEKVHEMVREITTKVRRLKVELKSEEKKLYHGETWDLMLRRWAKLEKDFKMKNGYFDINKIPDIYDCIKYDFQHNQKILQFDKAEKLYACSKALADIVIPQEYGITKEEKLHISQSYCSPLLRKIRSDLDQVVSQDHEDDITRLDSRYSKGVATPHRFVRTRLYFTSESHIHSMLTMLRYGGLIDEMKDEQWKRAMEYISDTAELNYMTQIVIMMYEDPNKEYTSAERFHVELHFSPGAYTCDHTAPKDTHVTKSMTNTPLSHVQERTKPGGALRHHHAKLFGGPIVAVSLDPDKANIFDAIHEEQEKVPQPKSPDPNIPEWDWGEGEEDMEVKVNLEERSEGKDIQEEGQGSRSVTPQPMEEGLSQDDQTSSSTVCSSHGSKEGSWGQGLDSEPGTSSPKQEKGMHSRTPTQPISIARDKPIIQISDSDESRPQSLEEKRSQSFEEKSEGPEDVQPEMPMVERHYLTVQLPLVDPKQKHRHSFANIFTVPDFIGTGETFREAFTKLHVPSIQPLETLYNSLTLRQLDNFLERITTVKFMTPASTPPSHLMSPHEGGSPHGDALPTASSLSSSAKSSPGFTSPMTTEDVMMKLRIYMMEKQFAAETSTYHQPNREAISQPYIPPGHERQPHHLLHKPNPHARKQDQSHIHCNIPDYSLPGSGPGRKQFLGHAPFLEQTTTATPSQKQNSAPDSVPTGGYSQTSEQLSSYWPDSDISYSFKSQEVKDGQCPTELGPGQALFQLRQQQSQEGSHFTERHCVERNQMSSESYPPTLDQSQSEGQGQILSQGLCHDKGKGLSQSERALPNK